MTHRRLLFAIAFSLALPLLAVPSTAAGQDETCRFEAGNRTRGLTGGWANSWQRFSGPVETSGGINYVAFHPRMGWFVTNRLELFGEATLFVYHRPEAAITAGLSAFAGRFHFKRTGRVIPYITLGGGFVWTSLDAPEIDRVFNFQSFGGAGLRIIRPKGPGLVVELRTHHVSNGNTSGLNLGIDALTALVGVEWILR